MLQGVPRLHNTLHDLCGLLLAWPNTSRLAFYAGQVPQAPMQDVKPLKDLQERARTFTSSGFWTAYSRPALRIAATRPGGPLERLLRVLQNMDTGLDILNMVRRMLPWRSHVAHPVGFLRSLPALRTPSGGGECLLLASSHHDADASRHGNSAPAMPPVSHHTAVREIAVRHVAPRDGLPTAHRRRIAIISATPARCADLDAYFRTYLICLPASQGWFLGRKDPLPPVNVRLLGPGLPPAVGVPLKLDSRYEAARPPQDGNGANEDSSQGGKGKAKQGKGKKSVEGAGKQGVGTSPNGKGSKAASGMKRKAAGAAGEEGGQEKGGAAKRRKGAAGGVVEEGEVDGKGEVACGFRVQIEFFLDRKLLEVGYLRRGCLGFPSNVVHETRALPLLLRFAALPVQCSVASLTCILQTY